MKEQDIRGVILDLFTEHPGHFVSGEDMSKVLEVSRAYIWKNITRLRDDGYRIDAVPHLGYRLVSVPDKLLEFEIERGLATRTLGKNGICHFDTIDSTNDKAYRMAEDGAPEGFIVVSETQTRGKGRVGRSWLSPKGEGIYISVVLRPDLEADEIPAITLVAATSVAEAIRHLTGVPAMIKWPNDVMVNGRKVCGILTEMKAQPDRVDFLVLGIGINVNTPRTSLPAAATSLKHELEARVSRAELVRDFLERFEKDYRLFRKKGFAALREECKKHSTVLGKKVKITEHHRVITGTVTDIDPKGALVVKDHGGTKHRIFSGDVVLWSARQ